MKSSRPYLKTAVITVIALTIYSYAPAQTNGFGTSERIGVYDSRAVAVAFAGSPEHEKELKALIAEHKAAKEAGDVEKVARLEADGKARQHAAHLQGFSTAPVTEILDHITNALPQIQKDAGVTGIISKWDDAALKKHPHAKQVDVTMQLVDALHPNARQRDWAIKIQKTKPLSVEEVSKMRD